MKAINGITWHSPVGEWRKIHERYGCHAYHTLSEYSVLRRLRMLREEMTPTAIAPDGEAVANFAGSLRGDLITPANPNYDEARTIYNAMIDKRPALIARCANVADVIAAVNFARANDLDLAVHGGGHN